MFSEFLTGVGVETVRLASLGAVGYAGYQLARSVIPERPQTKKDKCTHHLLAGMTRSGKTEYLKYRFIRACEEGHSVILLETHGDLCNEVIPLIPDWRWDDVIIVEPFDKWIVPFNALKMWTDTLEEQNRRVEGLVDIFLHLWGPQMFGARSQDLVRSCGYAITDLDEEVSLLELYMMLRHPDFADRVRPHIHHDIARDFFEYDWPNIQGKNDVVGPPLNKIRKLLYGRKEAFCHLGPENLDLRQAIDSHKIVIFNFSEGKLTREISHLLSNLIFSEVRIATMSRADMPPEKRAEHFCEVFLDECPAWCAANHALAQMLSEGGKFFVSLTVVCQYLGQFDHTNQESISNNISNLYLLRSRHSNLQPFYDLIEPFQPEDVGKLSNYTVIKREMVNGKIQAPVKVKTPPPLHQNYTETQLKDRARAVRRRSERFTVNRQTISASITKRLRESHLEASEPYGEVSF